MNDQDSATLWTVVAVISVMLVIAGALGGLLQWLWGGWP